MPTGPVNRPSLRNWLRWNRIRSGCARPPQAPADRGVETVAEHPARPERLGTGVYARMDAAVRVIAVRGGDYRPRAQLEEDAWERRNPMPPP
ncbi:hypothetical protein [Nocardia arizonensis]|uniref:hypothetical protein n=1 Tax=Nocardia arizonensis TaxID=1141647 RepID=UPI0012E2C60F|nr:hypothetical protein [Nocardia arizonensis]